jgi:DNA-binding beta-propeller fold protein YncE
VLLGILVVFLLGGLATALDLKFGIRGKARVVEANSLLVLDARTLRTIREVRSGELPPHPSAARSDGAVWTVDGERNRLVATEAGHVVREVVVGTGPIGVAIGFGSAWTANAENGSVTRVEIAGMTVETIGLTDQPSVIATGSGYVWVLSARSKRVIRIDPKTNEITKTLRLTHPPREVVARADRVFLMIGE